MINHIPVMLEESIKTLDITAEGVYIDATLGGGGYSKLMFDILNEKGFEATIISFDLDIEAIENYKLFFQNSTWEKFNENTIYTQVGKIKLVLVNDNFANLFLIINELIKNSIINQSSKILGIVADLGLNSSQLDNKKGFSFQNQDQDLDMRLDKNSGVKASDLLLVGNAKQLSDMFLKYGDVTNAWKLAQNIKTYLTKPNIRVGDLIKVIDKTFGRNTAVKIDAHSKVFQALRIAVNNEYFNLEELLKSGMELLHEGGRMVIVSFHSGEDRIVKHFIIDHSNEISVLNDGKIITATDSEIGLNSRSRSAKLRGFIKK